MHTLKQGLRLWLQQQCQLLEASTHGVLIELQVSDAGEADTAESELDGSVSAELESVARPTLSPNILALYPEGAKFTESFTQLALSETAKAVQQKSRLHMHKQQDGTVYFGYPIEYDKKLWGIFVVVLSHSDPGSVKETLNLIQRGAVWLQFLLRESLSAKKPSPAEQSEDLSEPASDTDKTLSSVPRVAAPELEASPSDVALLQVESSLMAIVLAQATAEQSAITLVNNLASLFRLTRVSFGRVEKNAVQLLAISNSAAFDERAEPMQNLVFAMSEALELKTPVLYVRDQYDEQILHIPFHKTLCEQAHAHSVASFLVKGSHGVCAVITCEKAKNTPSELGPDSPLAKVVKSVSPVLALQYEAEHEVSRRLKLNAYKAMQKTLGPGHITRKLVLAGLASVFLLSFLPVDFKLKQPANLESDFKYLVTAPFDGYLGEISARPGDEVTKGTVLARIKDEDLRLERRRLASELQKYKLEYDSALAAGSRSESTIIDAQVDQAKLQLELLEKQLGRSVLHAPIDGVIVSNDVSQSLGAPIEKGETLFEVASSNKYKIAVYVREPDIRFVSQGQSGTLQLKSLPNADIAIRVSSIRPVAEIKDEKNVFRVEAQLDFIGNEENAEYLNEVLRPGMTGSAKIHIEKRSLAWVMFRDLWYWLRLQFWF